MHVLRRDSSIQDPASASSELADLADAAISAATSCASTGPLR
ncbi:hypothetical protein [Nonomuraea salmonea]|uniref:Uncharacterized protein n=1 Tax=Nonomuraea salmonea TaxID=46181 RepID=A0ABV5NWH8_9ACTN